jgi:hypothetical protein
MALQPLRPYTFSEDLRKLMQPADEDVRTPLEFIVPIRDTENDDRSEECADKAFYNMMGYVKMLQKHYSDMLMTQKIKPFSDEEEKHFEKHRYDIMLKIVEQFSIIEFVRLFPNLTKENEDGKTEFDLRAFSPFARRAVDGSVYIDEYALNKAMLEQEAEKERIQSADEAWQKTVSEEEEKEEVPELGNIFLE